MRLRKPEKRTNTATGDNQRGCRYGGTTTSSRSPQLSMSIHGRVSASVFVLAVAFAVVRRRAQRRRGLTIRVVSLVCPGSSERQLRAFERSVLGPEHAAEHARLRREKRTGQLPPARRLSRSSVAAAAALAGPPEQVGRWGAPFSIPVMAIHAAMLPTGKVMWFSYPKNPSLNHGGGRGQRPEYRAGVVVESGDGRDKACRPAAVARPGRRTAQAGQHLVRRPDLHRRWAAGGRSAATCASQKAPSTTRA